MTQDRVFFLCAPNCSPKRNQGSFWWNKIQEARLQEESTGFRIFSCVARVVVFFSLAGLSFLDFWEGRLVQAFVCVLVQLVQKHCPTLSVHVAFCLSAILLAQLYPRKLLRIQNLTWSDPNERKSSARPCPSHWICFSKPAWPNWPLCEQSDRTQKGKQGWERCQSSWCHFNQRQSLWLAKLSQTTRFLQWCLWHHLVWLQFTSFICVNCNPVSF